jgi:hypothetical protein
VTALAAGGGPAALERLATALGPGFSTTLVTGAGCPARLTVTDRRTCAGEDVYADDGGWFWWGHAERIAATEDPLTAAHRVTAALGGAAAAGGRR